MMESLLSPQAVSWALAIIGIAGMALQFAYNRWEKLFLLLNKVVFWVRNPSVLWDVEIDCQGRFEEGDLESVFQVVRNNWPTARKRIEASADMVIQAEGILLNLSLRDRVPTTEDRNRFQYFNIHFSDVRASYHESRQLVDTLARLVEHVIRRLDPKAVDYNATIRFSQTNPYFGLYAKRLSPENVRTFNCILTPSANGHTDNPESTVIVGKDCVSVSSETQAEWSRLSKKYLAVR